MRCMAGRAGRAGKHGKRGKVVFVGAGPGDPELLTLRGKRETESADVIVYAGSLIPDSVLRCARDDAILINSHGKSREELFAIYENFVKEGKKVVRLHSGDLSLYSAFQEQIEFLASRSIEFEVVPGVPSFSAASALLKREFTSPGVSQTIIITKPDGKTGKPERERLRALARHGATMIIFLGVHLIEDIVSELLANHDDGHSDRDDRDRGGYAPDTPVAVVHKASWRGEEQVITGTLRDIAEKVREAGIERQSLIIVGDVLRRSGVSMLYSVRGEKSGAAVPADAFADACDCDAFDCDACDCDGNRGEVEIFSLAQKSVAVGERVKNVLLMKGIEAEFVCLETLSCDNADRKVRSVYRAIKESFRAGKNIIGILPMGVLVRAIEPGRKAEDPWVICMDEDGRYVIPVLNGHRGANNFARLIAEELSAEAVITTHEE